MRPDKTALAIGTEVSVAVRECADPLLRLADLLRGKRGVWTIAECDRMRRRRRRRRRRRAAAAAVSV